MTEKTEHFHSNNKGSIFDHHPVCLSLTTFKGQERFHFHIVLPILAYLCWFCAGVLF